MNPTSSAQTHVAAGHVRKKDTGEPGNGGQFSPGRAQDSHLRLIQDRVGGVDEVVAALQVVLPAHTVTKQEEPSTCGAPPGSMFVQINATTGDLTAPSWRRHTSEEVAEVSVEFFRFDNGAMDQGRLRYRWPAPASPFEIGETRIDLAHTHTSDLAAHLAEDLRTIWSQATRQKLLDTVINDAQGAHSSIIASIHAHEVRFESVGNRTLATTWLDVSRPDEDYAPVLTPRGAARIVVDPSSREDVLDYLGRELLIAKGRFGLVHGARPGARYVHDLMQRVRDAGEPGN